MEAAARPNGGQLVSTPALPERYRSETCQLAVEPAMLSREVSTTTSREHPRYAHEAAVTFHLADKTVEGRTQNVSRGGLCASVAESLPVGTDIDISIVLVFENDVTSEPLRVPARAVWSTEVDEAHQVGIMFRPLTAELGGYLNIFLKYLDGQHTEKRPRDIPIDDRFR